MRDCSSWDATGAAVTAFEHPNSQRQRPRCHRRLSAPRLLLSSSVLLSLLEAPAARPGGFTECKESTVLAKWPDWLTGWPGGCLRRHTGSDTVSACNSSCFEDVECSAWQWRPQIGCLWAQDRAAEGVECYGAGNASFLGAQQFQGELVLHGSAAALHDLGSGKEVKGLMNIGPLGGANENEEAGRCKLLCYASHSCGVWQSGGGDCYIERSTFSISVQANLTTDSELAAVMVAGEEVRRGCPHTPHPVWLIMGSVDFAIGLLALLWAICSGTGPTREDPFRKAAIWSGPAACLCPAREEKGSPSGRLTSSKTDGAISGTSSASSISSVSNSAKDQPSITVESREADVLDNAPPSGSGILANRNRNANVRFNTSNDTNTYHSNNTNNTNNANSNSVAGSSSQSQDVLTL
mmetsp:Transcript_1507/g.3173  ORF Transcript_1507/g.3173 Transcript_1507/m.3173 type:complete len:409 (+) Transcript_1507:153-1379(+)